MMAMASGVKRININSKQRCIMGAAVHWGGEKKQIKTNHRMPCTTVTRLGMHRGRRVAAPRPGPLPWAGAATGLPAASHRLTALTGAPPGAGSYRVAPPVPPSPSTCGAPLPTPPGAQHGQALWQHGPPRGAVLSALGNQLLSTSRSGCYYHDTFEVEPCESCRQPSGGGRGQGGGLRVAITQ